MFDCKRQGHNLPLPWMLILLILLCFAACCLMTFSVGLLSTIYFLCSIAVILDNTDKVKVHFKQAGIQMFNQEGMWLQEIWVPKGFLQHCWCSLINSLGNRWLLFRRSKMHDMSLSKQGINIAKNTTEPTSKATSLLIIGGLITSITSRNWSVRIMPLPETLCSKNSLTGSNRYISLAFSLMLAS